jgi:quinol monooxygenase YgiN
MTIRHTVVFRLAHADGSAEERRFLADARAALTSIPGVQDFRIHRQVSAQSPLTHQFSMRFADQAAYDAYDAHPAHRGFVEGRWMPEVSEFQEYDFVELDADEQG